jgi:hypothetical protein
MKYVLNIVIFLVKNKCSIPTITIAIASSLIFIIHSLDSKDEVRKAIVIEIINDILIAS